MVYYIGQSIEQVKLFLLTAETGSQIPSLVHHVVVGASYLFPNFVAFDLKLQAAHGLLVPQSHLLWLVVYGASYSGILILLACWFFRRREFP